MLVAQVTGVNYAPQDSEGRGRGGSYMPRRMAGGRGRGAPGGRKRQGGRLWGDNALPRLAGGDYALPRLAGESSTS
jgi:hypothetical protein